MENIKTLDLNHKATLQEGHDLIENVLWEEGVVRFNKADLTQDDFFAYSSFLGENFIVDGTEPGEYRTIGASGRRRLLHPSRSIYSANGNTYEVPLHGELHYEYMNPPHLLWFFCEAGDGIYNTTTVCDGESLFNALSLADQETLLHQPLCYERYHTADFWKTQYIVDTKEELEAYLISQNRSFKWFPEDEIQTQFHSPAIRSRNGRYVFINSLLSFALRQIERPNESRARVCFADGSPLETDLVYRIANTSKALSKVVNWVKGDILILDNTRMIHGRTVVHPKDNRKLQVRMSDWERLKSVSPPIKSAYDISNAHVQPLNA